VLPAREGGRDAGEPNLMVELERRSAMAGLTPHLLHNWSVATVRLPSARQGPALYERAQRRLWDETDGLASAFGPHV